MEVLKKKIKELKIEVRVEEERECNTITYYPTIKIPPKRNMYYEKETINSLIEYIRNSLEDFMKKKNKVKK